MVISAVFSPDGGARVTASDDKTARTWDARARAPIGAPVVSKNLIDGCAWGI